MYCEYYKAKVLKRKTWFLSAVIRNESNMALARAIRGENDTFEFFVPKDQEKHFLAIMDSLKKRGIVLNLVQTPNNLALL